MEGTEQYTEPKTTPMGSVWVIVLCSMIIAGSLMGGYLWMRYRANEEEHRMNIAKLEKERDEIARYRAYLAAGGTSTPEKYFTSESSQ